MPEATWCCDPELSSDHTIHHQGHSSRFAIAEGLPLPLWGIF